jgi:molecular chaperone GrpE
MTEMSPRKRKDKADKARKKAASQEKDAGPKEAPIETPAEAEPELLTPAGLEELKKKADERDEYLDRFQRSVADFSNYQKRAQREADDTRKYAAGPMALNLLEVLDNFQRALSAAQDKIEIDYLKGFEMIAEQILSVLEKHGITPFDAEGKPFDPNFHDALFSVEDEELPDNTIMEELQKGYMQYDRLLRPARVKVSKRPAGIKEGKDEEAQDEPVSESEPSPDRGQPEGQQS